MWSEILPYYDTEMVVDVVTELVKGQGPRVMKMKRVIKCFVIT